MMDRPCVLHPLVNNLPDTSLLTNYLINVVVIICVIESILI